MKTFVHINQFCICFSRRICETARWKSREKGKKKKSKLSEPANSRLRDCLTAAYLKFYHRLEAPKNESIDPSGLFG